MLDNNGYVLLSEFENDTGRYFGEIDDRGGVMESLISMGIYKQLSVFDFQAHCAEIREKKSDARTLLTVRLDG